MRRIAGAGRRGHQDQTSPQAAALPKSRTRMLAAAVDSIGHRNTAMAHPDSISIARTGQSPKSSDLVLPPPAAPGQVSDRGQFTGGMNANSVDAALAALPHDHRSRLSPARGYRLLAVHGRLRRPPRTGSLVAIANATKVTDCSERATVEGGCSTSARHLGPQASKGLHNSAAVLGPAAMGATPSPCLVPADIDTLLGRPKLNLSAIKGPGLPGHVRLPGDREASSTRQSGRRRRHHERRRRIALLDRR